MASFIREYYEYLLTYMRSRRFFVMRGGRRIPGAVNYA